MLILLSLAHAQSVDGFAEARFSTFLGVDANVPVLAVQRFRPTFASPIINDKFELSTTIETGLSQGWRTNEAFVDLAEEAGVAPSLTEGLAPEYENSFFAISQAGNYLAVDRFYLDHYGKKADVRVGRQALNWGSGFAVNPSDPFPEVLITEPWKPRSGVNAARMTIPFGDLNSAVLVAGADDTFTYSRFAGRVTVNLLQADVSFVGAYREEAQNGIMGLDVKGTLGVGYWFEGVLHVSNGVPVEEWAAGLDYSIPALEQIVVTAQYYRNGFGDPESGAPSLFDQPEPFQPAFSGTDYLMAAVSGGLTPDVSVSTFWLQNLTDGSAFFVPSVGSVLGGAFELNAAAQLPVRTWGDGGEFHPASEDLLIALPGADGLPRTLDLGAISPDATVILWTRYNF